MGSQGLVKVRNHRHPMTQRHHVENQVRQPDEMGREKLTILISRMIFIKKKDESSENESLASNQEVSSKRDSKRRIDDESRSATSKRAKIERDDRKPQESRKRKDSFVSEEERRVVRKR